MLSDLVPRGLRRVVAFGSTSRFTKERSSDPRERALAARLAAAEAAVEDACAAASVPWTILRPTLIYGGGFDRNVSTIAAFVRRFGFFPVIDGGRGRRQPVHADDLAAASLALLDRAPAISRAYDLSGASTLSYREMVKTICHGLGCRPRIWDVPRPLVKAVLPLARVVPAFRHLSPAMADRMGEDLCFDHGAAARDFGYAPRPFTLPG
jgi:nucleoside-diphosphate-sugar epimerase